MQNIRKRQKNYIKRCEEKEGYILIGFLIFFPLLLSGMASLSVSALYLREKTRLLSLCRQHLLEIQGHMSESLEQLQKLNPLAEQLRAEKKETIRLLLNAPPVTREILLARLAYIVAQQIKLRLTQKTLIKKAEAFSAKHLRKLKYKMHQSNHLISSFKAPVFPKLAVVADPMQSLSPSYKTTWNFSKDQSIKIRWREDFMQAVPSFLKAIVGQLPSVKGHCASTLRQSNLGGFIFQQVQKQPQEGTKWQPVLLP